MIVTTILVGVAVGALFVCFTLIRPVRDCSAGCGSCLGAADCALTQKGDPDVPQ